MWNPETLACKTLGDFVQCREVDSFIEGALVLCPYSTYGCDVSTVYSQAGQHRRSCVYAPCPCLVPGCSVRAAVQNLRFHLAEEHSWRVEILPGYRKTTHVKFRRTEHQVLVVIDGEPSKLFVMSGRQRGAAVAVHVACYSAKEERCPGQLCTVWATDPSPPEKHPHSRSLTMAMDLPCVVPPAVPELDEGLWLYVPPDMIHGATDEVKLGIRIEDF